MFLRRALIVSFVLAAALPSRAEFSLYNALFDFQSIALYLEIPGLSFTAESDSSNLALKPNVSGQLGFEIELPYFGVGLASNFNSAPENKDTRGETKYFHFQYSKWMDRWGVQGYYNQYRSFYIAENGSDSNIVAVRPDIEVLSYGAKGYLAFNKKFSLQEIFSFAKTPSKTAGSFVMTLHANHTTWDGSSAIIPSAYQTFYDPYGDFRAYTTESLQIAAGWGGLWTNDFMYAGFVALLGFGYQRQELDDGFASQDFEEPSSIIDVKGVISSKNAVWNFGSQLHFNNIVTTIEKKINYNTSHYQINFFVARNL